METKSVSQNGFVDTLTPYLNGTQVHNNMSGFTTSNETGDLISALCKAKKEMKGITKNSKVSYGATKFHYADITAIIEGSEDHLTKHGLVFLCGFDNNPRIKEHHLIIVGRLSHTSGQFMETRLLLMLDKQDLQGYGSAITYGRRYSMCAVLGIATYDDDAQSVVSGVEKTAEEEAEFRNLLRHKIWMKTLTGTQKWWNERCKTKAQIKEGLRHMRNQVEDYDRKVAKKLAEKESKNNPQSDHLSAIKNEEATA